MLIKQPENNVDSTAYDVESTLIGVGVISPLCAYDARSWLHMFMYC